MKITHPTHLPQGKRLDGYVSSCEQTHDKQHKEQEKQHLGHTRSAGGDSAKTKYRGDQGDDKECDRPVQHNDLLLSLNRTHDRNATLQRVLLKLLNTLRV